MPITSGVRNVNGAISIGGKTVFYERASVVLKNSKDMSTWNVVCALNSFPGGDKFFSNFSTSSSVAVLGTTLITGDCDVVDIDYKASLVTMSGRSAIAIMSATKSNESFKNQTREDVVNTIAQKFGFSANIDTGALGSLLAGKKNTNDFVKLTDGISYAAVFHKLTELSGARWSLTGNTLNVTGVDSASGQSYQIVYQPGQPAKGNFIELDVTVNCSASQGGDVTASGFDTSTKKVITSTSTIPTGGGGQTPASGGGGLTYKLRADQTDQEHMQDLTDNKAKEVAAQQITVKATVVGDTNIDPTMQLALSGTAFDGSYPIIEIHHEISQHTGWYMTIEAKGQHGGSS